MMETKRNRCACCSLPVVFRRQITRSAGSQTGQHISSAKVRGAQWSRYSQWRFWSPMLPGGQAVVAKTHSIPIGRFYFGM